MRIEDDFDVTKVFTLTQIPELRKLVALKVEELKHGNAGEYLEAFEAKKKRLYDRVFDCLPEEEKGERFTGVPGAYWFELTRYKDNEWHITRLDPERPEYLSNMEIIPWEVINILAETPILPDEVQEIQANNPDRDEMKFNFNYIHFSDSGIFGVVRTVLKKKKLKRFIRKDQEVSIAMLDAVVKAWRDKLAVEKGDRLRMVVNRLYERYTEKVDAAMDALEKKRK
ncbi:MAG: hypothetical protein GY757_54800 [bacterium]|nr:hypothetical protein [bacterium]